LHTSPGLPLRVAPTALHAEDEEESGEVKAKGKEEMVKGGASAFWILVSDF
jgi:hypothetical protein